MKSRVFRRIMILCIIMVLVLSMGVQAATYVKLDYPGFGLSKDDRNLPGIPSSKVSDYEKELIEWGKEFGVNITNDMAKKLIKDPVPVMYENNILYLNSNNTVWEYMRDIIFLESMQNSINDWYENYYNVGVSDGSQLDRARKIVNRYNKYLEKIDNNTNPILNIMQTSESLRNDTDEVVDKIIGSLTSNASESLNDMVQNLSTPDGVLKIVVKDIISKYSQDSALSGTLGEIILAGDRFVSMIGDIQTAFSSSLGAIGILAKSLYSTLMYLYDSFNDNFVQAQFLVFHHFAKTYPDNIEHIFNDKGIINALSFINYISDYHGVIDPNDKIGQKLYNTYAFNKYLGNGSIEDIKAAYSTATIMIAVEGLDLFNAKRELINYLCNTDINNSTDTEIPENTLKKVKLGLNKYSLSLDGIDNNNIKNIQWIWRNKFNYCEEIDLLNEAGKAINNKKYTTNNQVYGFDISLSEYDKLKTIGIITAKITYEDNSEIMKTTELNFVPQHNNVTISTDASSLALGNETKIKMSIDGDKPIDVKFVIRNVKTGSILSDEVITKKESGSNNYSCTFDPSDYRGYSTLDSPYDLIIEADGKASNKIRVNVVDQNDKDGDNLPDLWELQYFNSIKECNPNDDSDNDGLTNYLEYVNGTHPLKPGADGIIHTIKLTGKDSDGNYISEYNFSGYHEEYSHLVLSGGTMNLNGGKVIIHGNVSVKGGSLKLSNGELIVNGEFIQESGNLDLDNGVLTIKGNLIQSGGTLNLGSGKLTIEKDYKIAKEIEENGEISYISASASLNMTDEKGYITIKGNLFINNNNTSSSSAFRLNKGIIEVRGNLDEVSRSNYANFRASEDHKVILSGEKLQKVNLRGDGWFNILEIKNESDEGIEFVNLTQVKKSIKDLEGKTSNIKNVGNLSLIGDTEIIGGVWNHDLTIQGNWSVTPKNLIINGDLRQLSGSLNLDESNLKVNGNIIQSGGTLNLGSGKLTIEKDYKIAKEIEENGEISYISASASLNMTDEKGYITIKGNLFINNNNTSSSSAFRLNKGIIEVRGNLDEVSRSNYANFRASEDHKVILSGEKLQQINIKSGSYFNILEIENISDEGIEFITPIKVTKLFNHNKNKFTLKENSIFVDYDEDGLKDNEDEYPLISCKYDLNNDGEINILDISDLALRYNAIDNDELYEERYDINKDGIIDLFDLTKLSIECN